MADCVRAFKVGDRLARRREAGMRRGASRFPDDRSENRPPRRPTRSRWLRLRRLESAPNRPPSRRQASCDTDREIRFSRTFDDPALPTGREVLVFQAFWVARNPARARFTESAEEPEIRASFDRQGRAIRPVVDPRVSFRSAFLKAFRPLSRPTGEPSWHGSGSPFRSSGGAPLPD